MIFPIKKYSEITNAFEITIQKRLLFLAQTQKW